MNTLKAAAFLNKLPIRDRFTRRMVPFIFNPNQIVILNKLHELEQKKKLQRLIVLKARRVGVSSLTDGLGICHCLSRDGARAMIVAHQFQSSKALFEVPTNLVTKSLPGSPPLHKLLKLPNHTQHRISFPHGKEGESELNIATAGSMSSGRGMAHSFLHLSEVAFYLDPGESFLALLPTVPRDLGTTVVLESTANGRIGPGEVFFDYWNAAVAGQNEFTPIFIPWLADPTCIANPELAQDAPRDDDEKELIKDFKASLAQIAWRRMAIETDCKGYVNLFYQEFPTTPEQAFISTDDPAFDKTEVKYARSTVREPDYRGDLIRTSKTQMTFQAGEGQLLVWERPKHGHVYYIGCDAARGEEVGDFAAFCIWNGSTGEQAARMVSRINPEKLADELDKAGRWYNNAMVTIELTGNLGLWAQKVLRDSWGYTNLYRWKNRDDRIGVNKPSVSVGWENSSRTRAILFDCFRAAVRAQVLTIRDEALVSQMDRATRKDGWRWEVEYGHDDNLMASMLGWLAREQWQPPKRLGGRTLGTENEESGPWRDDYTDSLRRHHEKVMAHTRRKAAGVPENRLDGV